MSTVRVDTITNTGNTYQINTNSIRFAYCSMYYAVNDAAGTLTISSSATNGQQMLFNRLGPSLGITANTTTSTWTHSATGTYKVFTAYRQNSGGDVWTVLGVTKAGNSVAVGVSARTGSEDSHNENYSIVYTVDSTSATYQLKHWSTVGKTVTSDFSGGNPGWTNYSALCGNTTGDIGRMVDYYIIRLGD